MEVVEASYSFDTTQIVVAFIGAIALIIVGWWQWGKKDKKAAVAEATTEATKQQVNVSETAIAKVAEKSLQLMQEIIDGLRAHNDRLQAKLDLALSESAVKDGIIAELRRDLETSRDQIRDLEHELERLRGRLDAILRTSNDFDEKENRNERGRWSTRSE